jgi:alkanesulfonate monooxygenase SsuD/methylene tetrahydromethanopterin reductase-like flavin-dependent oxidoreductase (luciferase family)
MDVFNGDVDTLEHKIDDLLELVTPIQFEEEYTDQPDITRVNAHECFIMGTPEECAEQIQARIDAGITKFMCWFVDFPDTGGSSPTRSFRTSSDSPLEIELASLGF